MLFPYINVFQRSRKGKLAQTTSKLENLDLGKPSPESSQSLRPALDVLYRIQHDVTLDSSDYVIGYLDRIKGMMEMPFEWWVSKETTSDDFIPQSRIRYYKRVSDNVVVWDRDKRKDLLFGSGRKQ